MSFRRLVSFGCALALAAIQSSVRAEGTQSHDDPQLGKIEGYSTQLYEEKRFDSYTLHLPDRVMVVEGHVIRMIYGPDGSQESASCLEINRSFKIVIEKLGEVMGEGQYLVGRFTRKGGNVFAEVECNGNGQNYELDVVEERPFRPLIQQPDRAPKT